MCEIQIWLNRQDFEYDIYALVRSFYPGRQTEVHRMEGDTPPEQSMRPLGEQVFVVAWSGGQKIYVECRMEGQTPVHIEDVPDSPDDRIAVKNRLKQLLYQTLQAFTGRALVWGTLTGIRPVKLAAGFLEDGMDAAKVQAYMEETYYLSRQKSSLCVEIALREREILDGLDCRNGYSLYIGIPFCPSICMYCSFSSYPLEKWKNRVDTYVETLCREIRASAPLMQGKELHTVYIGGGTPTTLEPDQMEKLLDCLEEAFPLENLWEFTVEAGRPDSIRREKLAVLKKHSISRISVNPQTMNQKTLDFIGRRHTVEEIQNAYWLVREMGFDNINMDLIAGLPGEGVQEVEHTLNEIRKLGPDSLTMHSLAVKRAARLRLFSEEHKELTFENSSKIMDMAENYAREMGLLPYYLYRQKNMAGNLENVGYAKPGKASLYNILMMGEKQSIVACGSGSISKHVYPDGQIERCENVKDVTQYIDRIDEMIERKKQLWNR